MSENTRSHEHSIEIEATAEAVWNAITRAEEIVRWFSYEARVEPGQGGSMFVSWGPGMEGTARIEIWEPNRHLRTVHENRLPSECSGQQPQSGAEPARLIVDYFLESEGGKTKLRLVNSGFGLSQAWDGEYDGTKSGWPVFLRNLRHAVVRHPGVPAKWGLAMAPVSLPADEVWPKLMDALGLPRDPQVGRRHSFDVGGNLDAVIDAVRSPKSLEIMIASLNDARFCFEIGPTVFVGFLLYGPATARAPEEQARWTTFLSQVFPQATAA